jgi:hypothetical protein
VKTYDVLDTIHREYQPRSYLEIGVNTGASLALSRTRTIGVDPAFAIEAEIHCDLQLVKATSDDFFARADALAHFSAGCIDLAFVDGLHLVEYVLRDFINVERHASWTSVILLDDVLPRYTARASRERGARTAWTGDVFKVPELLAKHRPDLLLLTLDTYPTGLLLILGADPENRVLEERCDEIVAQYLSPDPQQVPEAVLRCESAVRPASIAESSLWAELRAARDAGLPREVGWEAVRRSAESGARPAALRELKPAQLQPRQKASRRPGRLPLKSPPGLTAVRGRLRPFRGRLRKLRARRDD